MGTTAVVTQASHGGYDNGNGGNGTKDGSTSDFAYVCGGTCRAALVHYQLCGDVNCNRRGQPLEKVPVVYACPVGSCMTIPDNESDKYYPRPGLCTRHSNASGGGGEEIPATQRRLHAKAAVPIKMQLPILDPPEENRCYSSYWDNDVGHALSSLSTSVRAWCAGVNDEEQWMIIDAGSVIDSISGLMIANRKDGCKEQIVTRLEIDAATINENYTNMRDDIEWIPLAGNPYDTRIEKNCPENGVALRFVQPIKTRFLRLRPLEWQSHISLRCALLLSNAAEDQFRQGTKLEYRTILDITQLPANVPVTYIPGGLSVPSDLPINPIFHSTMSVRDLPTGDGEWAGRRFRMSVLEFNGRRFPGKITDDPSETRVFPVLPGQPCSIRVRYRATWRYNSNDYCPGCIVQLYYGMYNTFSTGVVEHGIHDHDGESSTLFTAPTVPGLYYITQEISLQYNYVPVHHGNHPRNSIAVLRVLPTTQDELFIRRESFFLFPQYLQNLLLHLLILSRRGNSSDGSIHYNVEDNNNDVGDDDGTSVESNVFSGLPDVAVYNIFSYLIDTPRRTDAATQKIETPTRTASRTGVRRLIRARRSRRNNDNEAS